MAKRSDPNQILLDLARNGGPEVVHLPYSSEFEAACREINPAATTEDKHRYWEEVLRLREQHVSSADASIPTQEAPAIAVPPEPSSTFARPSARVTRAPDATKLLFPNDEEPVSELQPWSAPGEPVLPSEQVERRQKMLADIADSRLATQEQRVAYILQRFPETRDSDIALYLRYWRKFQAEVIERWKRLELEVLYELDPSETLSRARRMIQSELQLFRGVEQRRRAREVRQIEFHEYLAAHRDSLPEVRFYFDETGNEGDKTYTGIAGVCIANWKQFDKHHAAMEQWRSKSVYGKAGTGYAAASEGESVSNENRFGPGTASVLQVIEFVDSGGVLRGGFQPSPGLPFPTHVVRSLDDLDRFRVFEHPRPEVEGDFEWEDIRAADSRDFMDASDRIADWWDGPRSAIREESRRFRDVLRLQLGGLLSEETTLDIADELAFVMMDRSVFGPNDHIHERLFRYYLAGGHPCGWRGAYPGGELVVFSP